VLKRILLWIGLVVPSIALVLVALSAHADDRGVSVTHRPSDRRVDVVIDGRPFTSYIYPAALQKPVLYPLRTAGGIVVTRGFPLDPKPGESADHPHHVGHWFNYGDVNGYDFWGHSDETPAANKPKMGTIVHKAVTQAASGRDRGNLSVQADWNVPDGSTLLREETQFVFSGGAGRRVVDRTTTWTATDRAVTFKDTKEGAFGIRVARALDHVSKDRALFLDERGQKESAQRVNNEGVTGRYIGSDGKTGDEVWGTRGPWMGLTGVVERQPVTLAILDHPSSYGYPTYWHARGYGLFAANPLGRQAFDPKQPPASLTLEPGKSVTFRHRILVLDGELTRDALQKEYDEYVKAVKR
jgi:hypothetical protein